MSDFSEFNNPWNVEGEHYSSWINEDIRFWDEQAEYIKGERKNAPVRQKNPMTKEWITDEELQYFKKTFGRVPEGNPYDWIVNLFRELDSIRLPSLPADTRLVGDWGKMFEVWVMETTPDDNEFHWVSNSKTIFEEVSSYSQDIVKSVSFSDAANPNCIKNQFFSYGDENRPNPVKASFRFVGPESGKENYYSWVEWFVGSYDTLVYWEKLENGSYDVFAKVNNTTSWYSGTRLPKTWQQSFKKVIGFELTNLVDSAPRGETIRRKLPTIVILTLDYLKVNIPSFGGNWDQEFYVKTNWIK